MRFITVSLLLLSFLAAQLVQASEGFIVSDIQVRGLQRISLGTVFNYLPVSVGDTFTQDKVAPAIRALFKTGFFKDVSLEQEGSSLIIYVVERPSIAKIIFDGNKDLSKEDLKKALDKIGLSEGKIFDRQVLDKVEQELNRQYLSHGKYGVNIKTEVTELTRNRVGIHIEISEGKVAKIKEINIIGNAAFDDQTLLSALELSTTNWLSFYNKDDQYSKQKLSADLESLRSYYLDRGYINFNIESAQVAITPDKKDIYITINVKEGDVYTIEKVKLTGNLIAPPEELIELVSVGPGEIFSRKNATETSKAISDRLGNDGYAFANVNMIPEVNEKDKTVAMTFFVDPGKRAYVRHINVKGNTKTRDEVIRREMRQMESSWASSSKIERSKTRLERLGYFETVGVETPQVPGTTDQIDVDYSIVEKASGNLSAGIGFSQVQGIVINANISQDNVFGSGKRVNLAFNNSSYATNYQFGFFDPYFTVDGVSMGYHVGYSDRDASQINIANYSTEVINGGFDMGIPLNEFDQLRFGFDLENTKLTATDFTSREINEFIDEYGDQFLTFSPTLSWIHDTLNRAIFPTEGGQQRFSALTALPGGDLTYYKLGYKHQHYFPLSSDFTLRLLGEIDYGDGYGDTDELPFFENYFAGGTGSVRGFRNNTLGPRDHRVSDGSPYRPFGGSTKMIANAEVFFPVPFLSDIKSLRMGIFFDAGTVDNSFSFDDFRYSTGISGEWLSPFGALSVSAGLPLNAKDASADGSQPADEKQIFQFNFGQNF